MKLFGKYLISYLVISGILFLSVALFAQPKMEIKKAIICGVSIICFFVIPMSIFFSWQGRHASTTIQYEDVPAGRERICAIIQESAHRKLIYDDGNKSIYAYFTDFSPLFSSFPLLTKYQRWLTENVVLEKADSSLVVSGPKMAIEAIKRELTRE